MTHLRNHMFWAGSFWGGLAFSAARFGLTLEVQHLQGFKIHRAESCWLCSRYIQWCLRPAAGVSVSMRPENGSDRWSRLTLLHFNTSRSTSAAGLQRRREIDYASDRFSRGKPANHFGPTCSWANLHLYWCLRWSLLFPVCHVWV